MHISLATPESSMEPGTWAQILAAAKGVGAPVRVAPVSTAARPLGASIVIVLPYTVTAVNLLSFSEFITR
jgi:hypothetical protein